MNEMNATISGLATTTFSAFPLGIIVISVILTVLLLTALSSAWFRRFSKAFGYIATSILYFVKGLLTIGTGYLIYLLANVTSEVTSDIPPIYYVYVLLGYIGCSIIGYVATKLYDKLKKQSKKNVRRH
jgi:glucan phosphoethanolaminetransferase (alkaline phosphatase superfamily)